MGEKAVPPIPPRLLIVMDAPPISSGPILRACARAARSLISSAIDPQALAVGVPDDRHHQAVRRVHCDTDVDVLLEDQRSPSAESDALKRGNARSVRASAATWKASDVSFTSRACASAFQAERRPSMAVTSARS
jgi:hypothetical protein